MYGKIKNGVFSIIQKSKMELLSLIQKSKMIRTHYDFFKVQKSKMNNATSRSNLQKFEI